MAWNGGLARVPRAGSAPYEPIEPDWPYDYFIHGDQIYWTENGKPTAVYSCPKSGCTGEPAPVMNNIIYGQHITHDNDTIYVLDMPDMADPILLGGGQRLLRCPMTGCNEPAIVLDGTVNPTAVASDNEHIYAVVQFPSHGLVNADPAAYCSGQKQCYVVLMISK